MSLLQMGLQKSMTFFPQVSISFRSMTTHPSLTRPLQRSHLNPVTSARRQSRRANVQKRDWAHEVDINKPMANFHELVPEMAHKVCTRLSSNALTAQQVDLYSTLSSWTRSRRRLCIISRWGIPSLLQLTPQQERLLSRSTPLRSRQNT